MELSYALINPNVQNIYNFMKKNMNEITKFEGAEKKLEIILNSPIKGLKENINNRWDKVIKACDAIILSKIENNDMAAYLLSESSLFVWNDRILIITCGKTTLTKSIKKILSFLDKEKIALIFYERKNFLFPGEQPDNFGHDIIEIKKNFSGTAFRLGSSKNNHIHMFHSDHKNTKIENDVTFQILMHDLPPFVIKNFSKNISKNKDRVIKNSGLDNLYPGTITDTFLLV